MVNIEEMNKEQYIAWRVEKNNLETAEITEMWDEFEGDAKGYKVNPAEYEQYVHQRFNQAFAKKSLRRGADSEKFKVIVVGASSSDFGATKVYKKAMKIIESEDEGIIQAAISKGMLNTEREPIYPPETKNDQKRGKVINLVDEKQTSISVISKRLDKEDKFKLGTIQIQTKQLKKMPTLFSVNEVELVPGKKCTDILDVLYGNDDTRFKEEKVLSEDKVEDLFNNFYQKYIFDMGQLEEVAKIYPDPNAGNWDKFVLVKANVVDINVTREGLPNLLTIIDKLNEDASATVWLPEEVPINFDYRTQGIWIYGTVSFNTENNMPTINGLSVYVPEQFRVTEKAKEISPEGARNEEPKVEAPKQKVDKDVEF